MSALFRTEGEEAAPIKLCLAHELKQLVVIFFGLAGIPHDEVATECCIRLNRTNALNTLEETILVTPTTHAT